MDFMISEPKKIGQVFKVQAGGENGQEFKVEIDENGGFKGLPPELQKFADLFSNEELKQLDPKTALNVLTLASNGYDIPSDKDFSKDLETHAIFKKEDPSQFYEIVKKIGYGGFARVFLVKRKQQESSQCALKFIEPKNEKERNIIKNELGIMMMCQENDNVLRCFEAFDYRQRLWIFLEYMDGGCLTPVVEERKGNIPENVCAYILY